MKKKTEPTQSCWCFKSFINWRKWNIYIYILYIIFVCVCVYIWMCVYFTILFPSELVFLTSITILYLKILSRSCILVFFTGHSFYILLDSIYVISIQVNCGWVCWNFWLIVVRPIFLCIDSRRFRVSDYGLSHLLTLNSLRHFYCSFLLICLILGELPKITSLTIQFLSHHS